MVTKKKNQTTSGQAGRVKVGKLKPNEETVRKLPKSEVKKIRGGRTSGAVIEPRAFGTLSDARQPDS